MSTLSRTLSARSVVVVTALTSMVLLSLPAAPAHAAQALAIQGGEGDPPTFGPNQLIEAIAGFNITRGCEPPGQDDPLTVVQSDVYVVPSGSRTLSDVSGQPNTAVAFGGLSLGLQLGFTQPSGTIPPGEWAVIFDECQDGAFDPGEDAVFDPAFRVVIPATVPALPEIAELKAEAALLEGVYQGMYLTLDYLETAQEMLELRRLAVGTTSLGAYVISTLTADILEPLYGTASSIVEGLSLHYGGIAADPPDEGFAQLTTLAPAPDLTAPFVDRTSEAVLDLAEEAASEGGLAEGFLRAMERYQGAAAAGDAEWALVQARAAADYARLLSQQLPDTSASTSAYADTVLTEFPEFAAVSAELRDAQIQVVGSGLGQQERNDLRALGLSDADIDQALTQFAAEDIDNGTKLLDIAAALSNRTSAASGELADVADAFAALADQLEVDPLLEAEHPAAEAGGPYSTEAAALLTLDGSGSAAAAGRTLGEYTWDLDRDGVFDDATGVAPNVTFDAAAQGLIGLQVVDDQGRAGIDYAMLSVSDDEEAIPPVRTAFPPERFVQVEAGRSTSFRIEGAGLQTNWLLDDEPAATGVDFTFASRLEDVGVHVIRAETTGSPTPARPVVDEWTVVVRERVDGGEEPPESSTVTIEITSPLDGSSVDVPPETVTVSGTVAVGTAGQDVSVVYALDASGSTLDVFGLDCNGDGAVDGEDDLNATGSVGDILDCEISGTLALNASLATVPGLPVGLVGFTEEAAPADLGPQAGEQFFTTIAADLEEVTRSVRNGPPAIGRFTSIGLGYGATSYDAALRAMSEAFSTRPARERKVGFLLSDGTIGELNDGQGTPLQAAVAADLEINTYSIGELSAGCGGVSPLRLIADATGGTCAEVDDPSDLRSVLGEQAPEGIDRVEVALNGAPSREAAVDALGRWSLELPGVRVGPNTLEARALTRGGEEATDSVVFTGRGTGGPRAAELLLSDDAQRMVEVRPLDGQVVAAGTPLYVFAGPPEHIDRVEFSLDGAPFSIEEYINFDLARTAPDDSGCRVCASSPAFPLDSGLLTAGPHTVVADVTFDDGSSTTLSATFTVTADSGRALEVSDTADRSDSVALEGAELSGDAYVFLGPAQSPIAGVDEVVFLLDGRRAGTERVAPYDLRGGSPGVAVPLDTTTLTDGVHTLQAEVRLAGSGVRLTHQAVFTVRNPALLLSDDAQRMVEVRPLDGQVVAAGTPLYVFAGPPEHIDRVEFSLDGAPFSIEEYINFDLARTAPDDSGCRVCASSPAFPLDSGLLTAGPHTVVADVTFDDGSSTTLSATFTVTAATARSDPGDRAA